MALAGQLWIVARDRVVGQLLEPGGIATGGEELERANADVARRHARQHRARQRRLPVDRFARRGGRQRPRGRHPERVHRFAQDVLAQHRAHRRLAIAAARKRRPAGALELNIAALPVRVDHFAEQQRPPVAQLRHEVAKLVAGVGLCQGLRARRGVVAGENLGADRRIERRGVQPQLLGQRVIQLDQAGRRRRRRRGRGIEARQFAGVRVIEAEAEFTGKVEHYS
jgi:hypothetical protein